MKYAILVEYDGSGFCGMQKQPNKPTIQGELESAISKLFNIKITINYAGRTDTGVHAIGQVIDFEVPTEIASKYTEKQIINGTNFYLRAQAIICKQKTSIACKQIKEVPDDFHSRFSAIQRNYIYKIINREYPLAIFQNTHTHIKKNLDLEEICNTSRIFIGKHDFSLFRSSECQAKSPIRTIDNISIQFNDTEFGLEIKIFVSAKSFLHNMVRRIVGALISVGERKLMKKTIQNMLQNPRSHRSPITAPHQGLYFLNVNYPIELFNKSIL